MSDSGGAAKHVEMVLDLAVQFVEIVNACVFIYGVSR